MEQNRSSQMPTKVTLDLTPIATQPAPFRASDFRLHGSPTLSERHWLLRHPYGREVLLAKLKEVQPDVRVHRFRTRPEDEQWLDRAVDYMGLRDWPEPKTIRERVRASFLVFRYIACMAGGYALPDWRAAYST
jgi:hypothetical protein